MILTEQTEVRYVPLAGDNSLAKKDEQVVVTLQLPTAEERQKWNKIRYSQDGKGGVATEIERETKKVILSCVSKIENLSIKAHSGSQRPITTAEDLLNVRHGIVAALVDELSTVLLLADTIPEADAKN